MASARQGATNSTLAGVFRVSQVGGVLRLVYDTAAVRWNKRGWGWRRGWGIGQKARLKIFSCVRSFSRWSGPALTGPRSGGLDDGTTFGVFKMGQNKRGRGWRRGRGWAIFDPI